MTGLQEQFDLRDEKQAKEYLETVGVEYRFQCYHEKDPQGCHRLADYMEAFKKDVDTAFKVYSQNCEQNDHAHSCFKVGSYNLLGKAGCEKSISEGLKYFSKSCEKGYASGCYQAALIEQSGKLNGRKDYAKSRDYLTKGCDGNNIPSCNLLSIFYITGKPGVSKDMKKAFDCAFKACEKDHIYSCVNLSQMYRKGDGVEKNIELANKYKEKAQSIHKAATEQIQAMKFGE